jgi:PAS domain S-box-containing protein
MGAGAEVAGRRKDGTVFPAEVSLATAGTGADVLVMAAVRDAGEFGRAAAVRNRLASIVESSHDAIIGKTLGGLITSWNPGAERLYGYSAEEMIGHSVDRLLPEGHRDDEDDMLRRIALGEWVEQRRVERVHRDGRRLVIALTMSPIADAAGEIVGVASISRDISERERADARFRAVLEAAPDAMIGVDCDGVIGLVNAQAERLFGYDRAELFGRRIELLVPVASRERHVAAVGRYLRAPESRPMGRGQPLFARRKDGAEFPAEISLSALETDDGLLVVSAVRDVSERLELLAERERLRAQAERERLEAKLNQAQRIESLGQLAGGVAHDFNNLLAVILNYTSFVYERVAEAAVSDERWRGVARDLRQVQRAGERATQLTHQLLAFGRREVMRPQVLDLNTVVVEVQQMLRRTLGEHIEMRTALQPDLLPVLADPGQFEQVLVNLAVNARDAMPDGGELLVRTDNIDVPSGPTGEPERTVRVQVRDTGTGMPPDVVERVFEPFFTTKPAGEGTGLGLATVYGIVAQLGGGIGIDSQVGVGTTVSITLAATDEVRPDEEEPAARLPARGGESILVVEDEEALREVTRRILARNGYQVRTASNGPEALALPDDVAFDLLLTDVVMPQMLGKELAARMVERRPDIRVLYMSGYAQPVLASRGTLDPGVILVEKPFSETVLLERVRDVLDAGEPARSPAPS